MAAATRLGDTFRTWGSTPEERSHAFPCDGLIVESADDLFRAVSVAAPASVVFRWLCQLRVAPYSYDWIDNLGRRSPRSLTPGLDQLEVGQSVMGIFELVSFERDVHLTLRLLRPGLFPMLACSYTVSPEAAGCRLVVKLRVARARRGWQRALGRALPSLDWIMMRRQLLNLKRLAERSTAA